jgi:hypothetical protein
LITVFSLISLTEASSPNLSMLNLRNLGYSFVIFSFAYALRRAFFCGFILGDDVQEYALLRHVMAFGPDLHDQLNLRIGVWGLNYLFSRLFGVSETAFFMPTWILSSLMGVVAYVLLTRWGHATAPAFWGGMFVASAPFEVLIGTVRANDLFLAVAVVGGILAVACLQRRPILQGCALAVCLWLGLYVKVWALYFFPVIIVYYAALLRRENRWQGGASFLAVSMVLHGAMGLYWWLKIGTFVPFITYHPPTTPIPPQDLRRLFSFYPRMLFSGSEFGTTLFGAVPYLLIGLLLCKSAAAKLPAPLDGLRLDPVDRGLMLLYGTFFVLLNFFPTTFSFNQYYSIPRIFRYLAPLSFPMTLHVAKMLCDMLMVAAAGVGSRRRMGPVLHGGFIVLIILNVFHANAATRPGQDYRRSFQAIVQELRAQRPPAILVDSWIGFFWRELYLKDLAPRLITVPVDVNSVQEYEAWLVQRQGALPAGSVLVTGLSGYVHYGPYYDGFRLSRFSRPLHPDWTLVKEYDLLGYLPVPERARLWRLSESSEATARAPLVTVRDGPEKPTAEDLRVLYDKGLKLFERGDCTSARSIFQNVSNGASYPAVDAHYFYGVCLYREGDWMGTVGAFEKLLKTHPTSQWTAAAHWHIAMALRALDDENGARRHFEYVISHFPHDGPLATSSKEALRSFGSPSHGLALGVWDQLKRVIFN